MTFDGTHSLTGKSARRADHGVGDAGVAGRRVEQHLAGRSAPERSALRAPCCAAGAILHGPAGIEPFGLAVQLDAVEAGLECAAAGSAACCRSGRAPCRPVSARCRLSGRPLNNKLYRGLTPGPDTGVRPRLFHEHSVGVPDFRFCSELLLEAFADLRSIADSHDDELVEEQVLLRDVLHGLRIDDRDLLGEIRVVVQRQPVREERRQASGGAIVGLEQRRQLQRDGILRKRQLLGVTRVSPILLSSFITSCTAGAVTSVRTPVATENGPPLRQNGNCEFAPYV